MDQDPNTAGGTADTENIMVAGEPSQDTQTSGTETSATSPYIDRDLRLPSDKEKRRLQTIVVTTIGILLLVLIGFVVWFFAFYNHPDKVMLDGVNNILRASNISLDGGGSAVLHEGKTDGPIKTILINLDSSSAKLPNTTDVSLFIDYNDDKSLNLQLGTVQLTDGAIYLKISGIMESLRSMDLESNMQNNMEEFFNNLETIDGEWWRISVRDVLQNTTGSEELASLYSDIYDCAIATTTRDHSKTLVSLYKQNQFINVEPIKKIDNGHEYINYKAKSWHNLYEISLDKEILAQFLNSLPETEIAAGMYTCYNAALEKYTPDAEKLSAEDIPEISASDISIPDNLHLYAEVSQFGHEIRSLWGYIEDEDYNNVFSVMLNYQDVEVAAPSEYRDITELFQEISIDDIWGSLTLPEDEIYIDESDYELDPDYTFEDGSWMTNNEMEKMEWQWES